MVDTTPDVASIASLLGDRTRARMIAMLMDGRARTATELALEGGVTPSTASSHLARLADAGLVVLARQGRHRYFRIATPAVAAAVEGLMTIAPARSDHRAPIRPEDAALRRARVCYDHLAGEVAVRLLQRLHKAKLVSGEEDGMALTPRGESWCDRVGIDLAEMRTRRRLVRPCLDWSERRAHLGGAVGAALLERLFALRYARREADSRAVLLTPRGEAFVEGLDRL